MIPSISASRRVGRCSESASEPSSPTSAGDLGARHDRDVQREHLVTGAPERRLRCAPAPRGSRPAAWSSLVTTTARGIPTSAHSRHSWRGDLVDRLVGRGHEQRAVGGAQPGPQLADEVGVAGGVDQVDLHPAVHERGDRERHRPAVACARLGSKSETVVPSATVPGTGQGAGADQQRLEEGGLAAGARPHQHDVADLIGLEGLEILSAGCTSSFVRHGDTLLLITPGPPATRWHGETSHFVGLGAGCLPSLRSVTDEQPVEGGLAEPEELEPEQGSLDLAAPEDRHDRGGRGRPRPPPCCARRAARRGRPDARVWDELTRRTLDGIGSARSAPPSCSTAWPPPVDPPGRAPGTSERTWPSPASKPVNERSWTTSRAGPRRCGWGRQRHRLGDCSTGCCSTSPRWCSGRPRPRPGRSSPRPGPRAAPSHQPRLRRAHRKQRAGAPGVEAGVRGFVVDATAVHDRGASEAQELGASLAVGAAYLRGLPRPGFGVEEAADSWSSATPRPTSSS